MAVTASLSSSILERKKENVGYRELRSSMYLNILPWSTPFLAVMTNLRLWLSVTWSEEVYDATEYNYSETQTLKKWRHVLLSPCPLESQSWFPRQQFLRELWLAKKWLRDAIENDFIVIWRACRDSKFSIAMEHCRHHHYHQNEEIVSGSEMEPATSKVDLDLKNETLVSSLPSAIRSKSFGYRNPEQEDANFGPQICIQPSKLFQTKPEPAFNFYHP